MTVTVPPPRHGSPRRSLRTPLLLALGLGAAAALVAIADPRVRHVPLCPLHALTGLDCPLCGGLRAVASLARGRIGEALSYNLLVTLAVPLAVALWFAWVRGRTRGRPLPIPAWAPNAGTVLLIGFMIIRNLPPFGWLGTGG